MEEKIKMMEEQLPTIEEMNRIREALEMGELMQKEEEEEEEELGYPFILNLSNSYII